MGSRPRGLTLRAREVIRDSRTYVVNGELVRKFRPQIVFRVFVK